MGPDGARAINRVHGTVVVQDPAVAEAYAMLTAVIERYAPDIVLPLRSIANALVALVMAPDAAALSSRASVAF
jgi:chemotaxis response regulator CheB